ncbi:MAG: hypothetical protein KPEEDBHJ_02871 [Anaerolineales bacterium]|nr:hypothetical protein [Anaerolineales bacterium]
MTAARHQHARAFIRASQHRTDHDGMRASRNRLGDVARVADPAVGDDGRFTFARRICALDNRRQLGDARTRHLARDADRAGTDADLHCINPRFDQAFRPDRRRHIAADDLRFGIAPANIPDHFNFKPRIAMSDVHHDAIRARLQRRFHAAHLLVAHAHRRADRQAPLRVLRRFRELRNLHDVFQRHQPSHFAVLIHKRKLLHAMLVQQTFRFLQRRPWRGDMQFARHDRAHRFMISVFEKQVAGCDNADQFSILIHDQNAARLRLFDHPLHFADRLRVRHRQRILHHERLGFLHALDLPRLLRNRHKTVNDSNPAFARHRNRHLALGHHVHVRRNDRRL